MEKELKKDLKAVKNFGNEFKTFISKGNVVDLAVGVIIGAAFRDIVNALVSNILMPLIGLVTGGINFDNLMVKVGEANITYGVFIEAVINFLIIAFCIFLFVKFINKLTPKTPPAPVKDSKAEQLAKEQNALLTEIRDSLKKQRQEPACPTKTQENK